MTVGTTTVGNATVGSLASALSAPDAPTALVATSDGHDTTLSWSLSPTDIDDVSGQRIYRSTTASPSFPDDFTELAVIAADMTSDIDADAPTAAPLSYAVTAYNSAGESQPTTDSFAFFNRSVGLSGDGATDAARGVTRTRAPALVGTGRVAASRAVTKSRSSVLVGDGAITASRAATKSRSPTINGNGQTQATVSFRDVFATEQTRDLDWDYNFDRRGFESEWSYQTGSDDAGSVAVYITGTLGETDPCTPTVVVDYDADGDGDVDERSLPRSVPATGHPIVMPELSGGDGYYRLLLQDLRPDDILVAVTVGPTHT